MEGLQLEKVINMIFERTTEMIADIFTKALDKTSFMKFRNMMVKDCTRVNAPNANAMIRMVRPKKGSEVERHLH